MSAERAKVLDQQPIKAQAFAHPTVTPPEEANPVVIAGITAKRTLLRANALDQMNQSIIDDQHKKAQIEKALVEQKLADDVKVEKEHVDVGERLKIQRIIPLMRMHSQAIATSSDKHVIEQHINQMLKILPDHVTQMSTEQRQQLSKIVSSIAPALNNNRELLAKHTTLMNILSFERKPADAPVPQVTFGLPADFLDLSPTEVQKKYKLKLRDLRKEGYKYGLKSRSAVGLIGKLQRHLKALKSGDHPTGFEESKGREAQTPPIKAKKITNTPKGKGITAPSKTPTQALIEFLLSHAKA